MKIKILLPLLVFVMFFVTSCESILDTDPIDEISDAVFWKTNADAELGVASIYDAMQDTYRLKHFYWGDFRSDNYVVSGAPNPDTESLITNVLDQEQEGYLRWNDLYKMIFRANTAIEKIPQIPQYNESSLGEAYALRAYAYFDAYRVWGGVPIFKDAALSFSDDSFKEKSAPADVLALALSDLEEAEKLITTQAGPNSGRFTVGSILAFKAKVLMFLQRHAEANIVLQQIIDLGNYSLTTNRADWSKMFINDDITFPANIDQDQEGTELIMSLKFDFGEDGRRASGVYQLHYPGVPGHWISPKVVKKWTDKFPTDSTSWADKYPGAPAPFTELDLATGLMVDVYGDYRYFETVTEVGSADDLRVSKYTKVNISPAVDDTNIALFRYADMLLLKAEAENQLGNPQAAIDLLNQIRVARSLPEVNSGSFPDVDINDKDAMENFILDERQLELFAEGTRWWDLVRTNKAVEIMGPINGQTEATLIWPIYFRHLIDNPKLVQNVPY